MPKAEFDGITVADSAHTEQAEGNHYFPREGVDMIKLKPSPTQYTCPWKGDAEYFHLELGAQTVEDAAWSYPHPKPAAQNIAGHIAFDRSKGVSVS